MEKHELVDINGNKTGKILTHVEARDINNVPNGCYISVVGVVIINENDEILLQKRSRFKRANPSKWGICGGKVDLGETPLEAGIRETLEEIGIFLNKEELKFLSMDTNEKSHFTVYYVRKSIDINECKLQEEELEQVKYFKIEDLEDLEDLDNEGFEWIEKLKKIIREEEKQSMLENFESISPVSYTHLIQLNLERIERNTMTCLDFYSFL